MSAGNMLALSGWILFGVAFLLSIRAAGVIRFFGGLARLHRLHHWTGLASAGLLFSHGVFELYSDPESALAILEDPMLLSGWAGLALLLASTALAFSSIRHRIWILLHWILGAAWAAGLLHAFAFRLSGLHSVLVAAGAALAFFSIAASLVLRFSYTPWKVANVKNLGAGLMELELIPPQLRKRTLRAGTIVFARFNDEGFSRTWHPFSVASCRFEPALRLLIRAAGIDTAHVAELKPGDTVDLAGPFAEFEDRQGDQVWIAGGVGIAPFLGMIRCLDFTRPRRIALVIYQKQENQELEKQLQDFASRHPEFSWQVITSPAPPAEFNAALESEGRLQTPHFLVCGPPVFMKSVRRYLVARGIPRARISTEEFTPW